MTDQTPTLTEHGKDASKTVRGSATILPFRQKACAADADELRASVQADRDTVLAKLWQALSTDGLVNHYQPQYELDSGEIVAMEALVRLKDRDGSLIFPDRFIGHAEESGLIVPLSRTVIRTACRDLAHWRAEGLRIERISINLSAHQVNIDHDLPEYVHTTAAGFGLTLKDLEFELTERQALQADGPGMRNMRTLSAMGARLAIDDFGTGFSSVAYLMELPIDTVKFDRSMIDRLPSDGMAQHMIRKLLEMAQELGMTTVGEGIETDEQDEVLRGFGCELGQGYLVARPMSAKATRTFLREAKSAG
jgi:EAL domain-containing protein (putative c-di-GMP-specific phosphodiesterase class I)